MRAIIAPQTKGVENVTSTDIEISPSMLWLFRILGSLSVILMYLGSENHLVLFYMGSVLGMIACIILIPPAFKSFIRMRKEEMARDIIPETPNNVDNPPE